ncbi:DUF1642 domain-containing protein [Streptococcus sp. 400_SSPC]|uniref:DUF1642 domain-containing protein n=1 Tax=Streptococcus sp. 400_SSPC TaxID=1579341 RepID=UPI00069CCF73|nr:DUF1642 domain-containing protein [Streptococcus sp. 400_SSPC]
MNGLIEIGDKVVLYGFFDGFAHKTDGTTNGLVTLKTGERVEIPLEDIMKKDQIITKKDIISRMKQLFPLSRNEWINEILHEFGDEFGLWKYNAGYEQGKLEGEWVGQQLKDADKIRQELNKPIVPQFVADWIEYCKGEGLTLLGSLDPIDKFGNSLANSFKDDVKVCISWASRNSDVFARAWLDGYEVEKEKRYLVKVKGIGVDSDYLNYDSIDDEWYLASDINSCNVRTHHTRKELEDAGFGWVFDCEGIEIEEVEG